MNVSTFTDPDVDFRPLAALLAVGDVLALTTFIVVGQINHGYRPLSNPDLVVSGVAPFLLAWGTVALLGGLYTAGAVTSVRRILTRTVPVWVVAVLLGQGLRASPLFRGGTSPAFLAVTVLVGGAFVVGWRLLVTLLVGRRTQKVE